jgi:hypothetical protein
VLVPIQDFLVGARTDMLGLLPIGTFEVARAVATHPGSSTRRMFTHVGTLLATRPIEAMEYCRPSTHVSTIEATLPIDLMGYCRPPCASI